MQRVIRRCLSLFSRDRAETDLSREMAAHLALLEEEHRRRGLSAADARLAARRAMGSVALAKDLHRDARSFVWIDDLRRDLKHSVRTLRRSPGFALMAIVALGLGIGVNTAFFTIVNAICLRGLPIDAPERVMFVSTRDAQNRPGSVSYAEFDDLRARTTAFGATGAYVFTAASVGDSRQPPVRASGAFISAGTLDLLGARPILGRVFRADEDRVGSPPVVVMGAELWSSRYASDPGIIGQSITINAIPTTVIGVMPRGFMFPSNVELWRPMANLPPPVRQARADRRLAVLARLTAHATEDQARADIAAIAGAWARDFPATNRDVRLDMVPINEQLNPSVAQRSWVAFITVGVLVLMAACANVANLLLMRAASRGREMAIRTSIGATRGRVIRQLLVESATLAALAGVVGVFLSWMGLQVLSGVMPPDTLPYWMALTIDGRVLAVTMAVCLGSVLACGLPSALHVSKVDLRDTLTESGSTTVARPARRWIAALLTAEFAVSIVLIAIAVNGVRSSIASRRAEFTINPASLLTMWVNLPADLYPTPDTRTAFYDRLEETVAGSAAVGTIALTNALPYGGGSQQPLTIADRQTDDAPPMVSVVSVSERYFSVLGVPVVAGRGFTSTDGRQGSEAAIVNRRFVRMFLPNADPIGARIRVGRADAPWLQIVGVTETVRQQPLGAEPDPVVFLPLRALPPQQTAILVRTPGDTATAISSLRNQIAGLDRNLPLFRVMSFEQTMRNAYWNVRLSNVLVRSIAVVALALALIGLYAVTGHTVQRWTRELGLRIALGAEGRQVAWLVLRRVLGQLAMGLGFGIAGTLMFERAFSDRASDAALNVRMSDPFALLLIVLSIVAVAVAACLVPIRRAASVDPVDALRAS